MENVATRAGVAGALTYQYYTLGRQGQAAWLSYTLAAVSGLAVAFLLYNIMAGGNPRKENDTPASQPSELKTSPQEEITTVL